MAIPGKSTLKDSILEEYPKLREEGYSPTDIANLYGVCNQYVYKLLDEIATLHGVSREALLIKAQYKTRADKGVSKPKRRNANMGKQHINSLTAKALYELTKRGYTLVDFCTKYHCDETALRAKIKRILHNNEKRASEAFNAILANSKKMNGPKGKNRLVGEAPDVTSEAKKLADEALAGVEEISELSDETRELVTNVAEPVIETDAEEIVAKIDAKEPLAEATSSDGRPSLEPQSLFGDFLPEEAALEELQVKLKLAQRDGVELLRDFAYYDKQFAQRSDAITSLNGKIKKLQDQIRQHEERIVELTEDRDEYLELRAEAYNRRQENDRKIEILNLWIRQRMVVELMVCDGVVEIVEAPGSFTMNDDGADELAAKLLSLAECEDLRVKDVRLLAKALRIKANSELEVKIVFDDDCLQRIYDDFIIDLGLSTRMDLAPDDL